MGLSSRDTLLASDDSWPPATEVSRQAYRSRNAVQESGYLGLPEPPPKHLSVAGSRPVR